MTLSPPVESRRRRSAPVRWTRACKWNLPAADEPGPLQAGLAEIRKAFPARFDSGPGSILLHCRSAPDGETGFRITRFDDGSLEIVYAQPQECFRALGILMGQAASGRAPQSRVESSAFTSVGAMIDVSRNGVLRIEAVEKLIRHLALMGFNQLMLYTEDTYEIPGEPLFGYFRGGYTQSELAGIDRYAAQFGMEVVPCIQTLGHLEQMLQWPCYHHLKDTDGVLLADDAEVEAFVEKMLRAASAPFRSRRIHIGMDEAHGIGSGRHRLRNGTQPPFEILARHLEKIAALCAKLGLDPMIWSDMFFRLGSKTNQYYDRDSSVPPDIASRIPAGVDLVYWDYYHTEQDFYDEWIARHRQLGKTPIFAAGVWTWSRWWAALPHSMATMRAGMASARQNGLSEVVVTLWGDDGMECDFFSALPALQYFAEQAYAPGEAEAALPVHFRGTCDATSEAWIAASGLDAVPSLGSAASINSNPGKWILWHDPLLSFLDHHVSDELPGFYRELARRCRETARLSSEDGRLRLAAKFASVLSRKSALHLELRPAYQRGDSSAIERIGKTEVPGLMREVRQLWLMHRAAWHATYRPFGWEVIEGRYGALLARLETLREKCGIWLRNPAMVIEELACESRPVWPEGERQELILRHDQVSTPSRIH